MFARKYLIDACTNRFRQITSSFYRGAHGVLVVFDLNNRETFDNLQRGWMKDIHKYSTTSVSIILVGNKSDSTQDRAVSLEDAKVSTDAALPPPPLTHTHVFAALY
jgi:Ras-related protein Rab-1A